MDPSSNPFGTMALKLRTIWPAVVTLVVTCGYLAIRMSSSGWDPLAVAEIGSRYLTNDPGGEPGYDGQFAYYVAIDTDPESVAARLDVPAYRYQRILYPILAKSISLNNPELIPWNLILINVLIHTFATWCLAQYFNDIDIWPGYAIVYGLWVGLVAGVGLDLHEPLAYGLIVLGIFAWSHGRSRLGALLIVCSLFAKETSIFFWLAAVLASIPEEDDRAPLIILLVGGGLFGLWQLWLLATFGEFGIGSGGAMATGFEWIPLMGFLRIGAENLRALALYAVIFVPSIILPVFWGLYVSFRDLRMGKRDYLSWALLINALMVLFLPFSTFREPLGLVRVATGFILALLVFSATRQLKRPLNYSLFWIPMLVLLVPR